MQQNWLQQVKQWSTLLILLVVGSAFAAAVDAYVSLLGLTMIYVIVVVIAAYTLSRNKSILCAFLAVACLNYFFVPPRFTFHVEGKEHLIALGALLIVALIVNSLVARLKDESMTAKRNELRARQLQSFAISLSNAESIEQAQHMTKDALASAFSYTTHLRFLDQPKSSEPLPQVIQDGLEACMKERKIIGSGTGRWNELEHWFIPIGDQEIFGAACIRKVDIDDHAGREHATALCSLSAQGLRRLHLSQKMNRANQEIERQQVQTMFLSAISHDLRTPLAVVLGAASSLQTQADKLSQEEQTRLLNSIVDETNYLGTITENTLQLVRLKQAQPNLRTDWESMEEIVGSVLQRIKQRHTGDRIRYHIETDLPLIQVDAVLIAQLLSNLIDNALKYSEGNVTLNVALVDSRRLQICVKDLGPGIPAEERESIFEAYTHSRQHDQSSQRGAGLGLAVCRAIARAHGGDLMVKPRQTGGSNFVVSLPVADTEANYLISEISEETK